jgi:hypothetical protein
VEHGGDANPGAQMPGVRRDRHHCLRGRPEQQIVDDRLVLPGDVGNLRRECEDDVEIADRQQVCLALGEPGFEAVLRIFVVPMSGSIRRSSLKSTGLPFASSLAAHFFVLSISARGEEGIPQRASASSRTPSGALRTIGAA